jgi:hypothetical protein
MHILDVVHRPEHKFSEIGSVSSDDRVWWKLALLGPLERAGPAPEISSF